MILLLGGTAETASFAIRLAEAGYQVLVSTATAIPLETGNHHRIARRTGILDNDGFAELVARQGIRAIVDATHPYAATAHRTARKAANVARIPYYTYIRPRAITAEDDIIFARSHEEAAASAFSHRRPVFLTTGSRNIFPYVAQAQRSAINLVVRVLDTSESREVCRRAGISENNIISGRGPFSLEQNVHSIRKFGIGVIVTKDGGAPGGVDAKIEAARKERCVLVVVSRPEAPDNDAFDSIDDLLQVLRIDIPPGF